MQNLKDIWKIEYKKSKKTLKEIKKVNSVASAFNTCIDAVVKISGEKFEQQTRMWNDGD